jgi:hypothetical protein
MRSYYEMKNRPIGIVYSLLSHIREKRLLLQAAREEKSTAIEMGKNIAEIT